MSEQSVFFDRLADRWDGMERPDIGERLERVVMESGVAPGMRVLDVGTGTGALIPALLTAMNGTGAIDAIDISAGMLRVAESKGFPGEVVAFHRAAVETYGGPISWYDAVMCNAVLPHFDDVDLALSRVAGLLRPGGLVVISHPIGREAVNRIHREAGEVVTEDIVPDGAALARMLEHAGFVDVTVIDEPEFYLVRARKRGVVCGR